MEGDLKKVNHSLKYAINAEHMRKVVEQGGLCEGTMVSVSKHI